MGGWSWGVDMKVRAAGQGESAAAHNVPPPSKTGRRLALTAVFGKWGHLYAPERVSCCPKDATATWTIVAAKRESGEWNKHEPRCPTLARPTPPRRTLGTPAAAPRSDAKARISSSLSSASMNSTSAPAAAKACGPTRRGSGEQGDVSLCRRSSGPHGTRAQHGSA